MIRYNAKDKNTSVLNTFSTLICSSIQYYRIYESMISNRKFNVIRYLFVYLLQLIMRLLNALTYTYWHHLIRNEITPVANDRNIYISLSEF